MNTRAASEAYTKGRKTYAVDPQTAIRFEQLRTDLEAKCGFPINANQAVQYLLNIYEGKKNGS